MPIDKVLSTSIADGAVTASAISNTANLSITSLLTSSNTVTIGTAAYFVGSGSVGIGTSSPDARLQVQGAASTQLILRDTSAYSAGVNGGGILFQGLDSASNNRSLSSVQGIGDGSNSGGLTLSTRSAGSLIERMRIDSSGNVGIGTSSPSSRLDVSGVLSFQGTTLPSAGTARIFSRSSDSGFYLQGATGGTTNLLDGSQNTMAVFGSSTVQFMTGNTERMRIDSSGKVLIGATSASAANELLAVRGASPMVNIRASSGSPALRFYDSNDTGSTSCQINYYVGTSFSLEAIPSIPMVFLTNNTERMRIDSGGNVGIGTSSPASKLHISGGTTNTARIDGSTRGGAWLVMRDGSVTGGIYNTGAILGDTTSGVGIFAETGYDVRFYTNGSATERMRINSSGNVGIGMTSPGERLEVAGNIRLPWGVNRSITIGTSSNWGYTFQGDSNELYLRDLDANFNFFHASYNSTSKFISLSNNTLRAFSGSVQINGSLSKSSGSFRIPHPIKPETHELVHSFVEAPQADNIYRGKAKLINGRAEVNIDNVAGMTEGTFVALNREVQCFTSNESGWDAVRGSVSGNILTIECQNAESTATISWLVVGERQDRHMYDTDWTDENGKVIVEPLKPVEEADEPTNVEDSALENS